MRMLRQILALLTLLLFPVVFLLALGLLVLIVILAASWAMQFSPYAGRRVATDLAIWLILPLLAGLGFAIRDIARARIRPVQGPELTRQSDPALWGVLDDVAARVGTTSADRVVVVPEVNAAVTEAAGHRELLIGLPVLGAFNVGQLRAALAHEFGHFAAGHTGLGRLLWRAHGVIDITAEKATGLGGWIMKLYRWAYFKVSDRSSRDHEWQADEIAARTESSAALASALRQLEATDLAWSTLLRTYVPLQAASERRGPLLLGLQELSRANAPAIEDATTTLLASDALGLHGGTHPPLGTRVERWGAEASATLMDETPAIRLLGGPPERLGALEGELFSVALPQASWADVAHEGSAARAEHGATVLGTLAAESGMPAPVTLRAVLDEMEAGRAATILSAAVDPGVAAEHRDAHAVDAAERLLARAAKHALVLAGARYHLEWDSPPVLRTPDGTEPQVADAVRASLEAPSSPSPLRELLQRHGADEELTFGTAQRSVPQPLAMRCWVKLKKSWGHLVVCDQGLLFVPWKLPLVGMRAPHVDTMIETVFGPGKDPRDAAGAVWIDSREIAGGKLSLLSDKVEVTLTDGTTLKFKDGGNVTADRAEFEPEFRALLGARMT